MENCTICPEGASEYREVEELTREAFWNVYRPGCDEHYVLHLYRALPEFVPELSLVLKVGGRILAHIMYSRTEICTDDGRTIPIMLFGPVSVRPGYQRQGYGSALIRYSLEKAAREFGCGAIAITGNPAYYSRFGFVPGQSMGVYYEDVRDRETPFFMIKELREGFLDGVTGVWREPAGYRVDAAALAEYDATFPHRVKEKRPGQLE